MARKRKQVADDDGDVVDVPNQWTAMSEGTGVRRVGPSVENPLDHPPKPSFIGPLLVTFLCCWPFGLVSLIYALQVPTKWRRGNREAARHAAERSEFWMYAAVGAQVFVYIGAAIYYFTVYRHRPYYQ